jgi:hypothetical protein
MAVAGGEKRGATLRSNGYDDIDEASHGDGGGDDAAFEHKSGAKLGLRRCSRGDARVGGGGPRKRKGDSPLTH